MVIIETLYNDCLTIKYLVGGGVTSNTSGNTINTLIEYGGTVTNATGSTAPGELSTVVFNNPLAAAGGRDGDTVEELRENSIRAYAEQKRVVTLQDYAVRSLSLPPQYGSIAKIFATQDHTESSSKSALGMNSLALALYVLAFDNNGHLVPASKTLKDNIKGYLSEYMMLTDAVDLKDAFVVNIGIKFEIITLPNFQSRDVLLKCTEKLKSLFAKDKLTINQPINISGIYTLLDRVKGVQSVEKIYFENKVGDNYSQYAYDIKGATRGNMVYPSYDPCIFEIKFPEIDIQGRVTTL